MIYDNEVCMKTEKINLEGVNNLFKTDGLYLAGQPSLDAIDKIKELGVDVIINFRNGGEVEYHDFEDKYKNLGIEYHHIPIVIHGSLDKDACKRTNDLINEDKTYFIHCGSANRVGGWLITYLVSKKGIDFEQAVDIARNSGLANVDFVEQARQIINNS
jgi:protein tyrosine phosphatase (PTP) superfamily phosphohydrolase (DUF442 family)